ncbi:uncharacterized protein LOC135963518 [Calliphora vicina]|uniref:uncharacterized protein LOC135963518 n=1 Tax=Calliphora vicina TaxID=7373 RepID=UPI00325C1375
MICEPILPQLIDLEYIKKSLETTKIVEEKAQDHATVEHKVSYEQKDYNMLPLFKDQFNHLNDVLSLLSNDYLACRWNKFLDNLPEKYIRIRLYMDYKQTLETREVRRKLLNGNFYGVNNKLAPIPQLSDPRTMKINQK